MLLQTHTTEEGNQLAHAAARKAFVWQHRQAMISQLMGTLRRRPRSLQSFQEATANYTMNSSRDIGVRAVRLDQIDGSVGRTSDFDQHFRPLKLHMHRR